MSRLRSAAILTVCSTLAPAAACKGGKGHESFTDPVLDGGACPESECPDAGEEGPDGALLEVELNNCPHVALEVAPARALVDQPIRVISKAEDADGDALSYEWLAEPDGEFDEQTVPLTSYRCQSLGRKTLRLVATDERGCEADQELEVSCVPGAAAP